MYKINSNFFDQFVIQNSLDIENINFFRYYYFYKNIFNVYRFKVIGRKNVKICITCNLFY